MKIFYFHDKFFFPWQFFFSMTKFFFPWQSRNPDKRRPKTTILLSPWPEGPMPRRGLYTFNTCPEGAHGPKGPCPAGAIGTSKYPLITRYPSTRLLEIWHLTDNVQPDTTGVLFSLNFITVEIMTQKLSHGKKYFVMEKKFHWNKKSALKKVIPQRNTK